MYCKKCGKEIPDGTYICNFCGESQFEDVFISAAPIEATSKKAKKKTSMADVTILIMVIVIIIALGVIVGAILYPESSNTDNSSSGSASSYDMVDSNLLTVDVTLPASFFTEDSPPSDKLSEEDKNRGFVSATINPDGSLTYTIKKSAWNKIVDEMYTSTSKSLNDIATGTDYPSIKKVEHNKNFSKVTFFVNKQEFKNSFDSFAYLGAYFGIAYYQMFNQQEPGCEFTVVDIQTNQVIDTVIYPKAQ